MFWGSCCGAPSWCLREACVEWSRTGQCDGWGVGCPRRVGEVFERLRPCGDEGGGGSVRRPWCRSGYRSWRWSSKPGGTVRRWLSRWGGYRLGSVVTGHAGDGNTAGLGRVQKKELGEILGRPPSRRVSGPGSGTSRLLEDVASGQVRRLLRVGLLLTCCSCASWERASASPTPSTSAATRRPSPGG